MKRALILYGRIGNYEFLQLLGYLRRLGNENCIDYKHKATGSVSDDSQKEEDFSFNRTYNNSIKSAIKTLSPPFLFVAVPLETKNNKHIRIIEEVKHEFSNNLESKIFEFADTFSQSSA